MNQKKLTNLLLILILAAFIATGVYLILVETLFPEPTLEPDTNSTSPKSPKESGSWSVYQDSENGFEFQYPSDFVLYNSDHPDYPQGSFLKTDGKENVPVPIRVVAVFPQDAYPATDFVSAWVAVASVAYDPAMSNVDDCKKFEKNGSVRYLSQKQIVSDVRWQSGDTGGVAAGTTIENRVYHTLYNQTCYEVDLSLVISNIYSIPPGFPAGNLELPPGAVPAEVNKFEVWNKLHDIFFTFHFLKEPLISENIPCDSTNECTKLAIKEKDPLYCTFAEDPVPEGGEDVQPTAGDLYCLRELVSVVKDVSICNQYAPNDSVCIWRATYLGE